MKTTAASKGYSVTVDTFVGPMFKSAAIDVNGVEWQGDFRFSTSDELRGAVLAALRGHPALRTVAGRLAKTLVP
jgi:hypothetical protein